MCVSDKVPFIWQGSSIGQHPGFVPLLSFIVPNKQNLAQKLDSFISENIFDILTNLGNKFNNGIGYFCTIL